MYAESFYLHLKKYANNQWPVYFFVLKLVHVNKLTDRNRNYTTESKSGL